jgi:Sulfotransferase family
VIPGTSLEARADPLVVGAVGGSGTRVFTRIARDAGVFMGGDVDSQEDSRPMSRFYSEFATDFLAANGQLDDDGSDTLLRRLAECLRAHLEGLPGPDHPWGVKNSRSMLMLPVWDRCFPEMRFLHVIRDGRDMAYSETGNQVRRHGRAVLGADMELPPPQRAMLWWARVNSAAADYGEARLGRRYMRVRLEDLCARPKRTIRSLFDFIDAQGDRKEAIAEVDPPPSLGRWRQHPESEVAPLVALGRTALERFGYVGVDDADPAAAPTASRADDSRTPRLSLADWRHAERLFHSRREAIVPIREPMVLISQIQRSGGHLLSALLDGHPQLHCHPAEVQVGHPGKADWPTLELEAGADAWLEALREPWLPDAFERGYRKRYTKQLIPVTIVPSFVDRLFRVLASSDPPKTQRAILDRYFTAFFNAWIDCQGLWELPKKWVAGFCPRLAWGKSRSRWWADYPDGRLVSLLRDPRGWYASARSHKQRYRDPDSALTDWRHGAEEIAAAKRESPDQVFVMTYERLVMEPEATMRGLASWLEIDWDPSLLNPTFNRRPVPANSSFDLPAGGIRTEPLERWRLELDDSELSLIEQREMRSYHAVRELADFA